MMVKTKLKTNFEFWKPKQEKKKIYMETNMKIGLKYKNQKVFAPI